MVRSDQVPYASEQALPVVQELDFDEYAILTDDVARLAEVSDRPTDYLVRCIGRIPALSTLSKSTDTVRFDLEMLDRREGTFFIHEPVREFRDDEPDMPRLVIRNFEGSSTAGQNHLMFEFALYSSPDSPRAVLRSNKPMTPELLREFNADLEDSINHAVHDQTPPGRKSGLFGKKY